MAVYLGYSWTSETRPVPENYLWRNFVFDPAEFDPSLGLTNGATYSTGYDLRELWNPAHQFTGMLSNNVPLAFSSANAGWLYVQYLIPSWLYGCLGRFGN